MVGIQLILFMKAQSKENQNSAEANEETITRLRQILKEADITEEDDIESCIILFKNKQYEKLRGQPDIDHKLKFNQQLDRLIQNNKNVQKDNLKSRIIHICQSVKLNKERTQQCVNAFDSKDYEKIESLKDYPKGKYKEQFEKQINLLVKELEKKQHDGDSWLNQSKKIAKSGLNSTIKPSRESQQQKQFLDFSLQFDPMDQDDRGYSSRDRNKSNLKQIFKFDPQKQLKNCLVKFGVDQNKLREVLNLFKDKRYDQILLYVQKRHKSQFLKIIQELKSNMKFLQTLGYNIRRLCKQFKAKQKQIQHIMNGLSRGNVKVLLQLTANPRKRLIQMMSLQEILRGNNSMLMNIVMTLTPLMEDDKIKKIITLISQRRQYKSQISPKYFETIQKIERKFGIYLIFRYASKNRKQFINQMTLLVNPDYLKDIISEVTSTRDLSYFRIFVQDQQISINEHTFIPRSKQYIVDILESKTYRISYCGRQTNGILFQKRSIKFNKKIIFETFLSEKIIICDEGDQIDFQRMKVFFQLPNKNIYKDESLTISNVQFQLGQTFIINLEIDLNISIFYWTTQLKYFFSSNSKLIDLRRKINETTLPFASQILKIINNENQQNLFQLSEFDDEKCLGKLSNKWKIEFQLSSQCSLQYYGFRHNIPLTYKHFSEFFIEDENKTKELMKRTTFKGDIQEQKYFILHFFSYLFSGIKRRFSITSVIDKFKSDTFGIVQIWNPSSEKDTIKVNQSFIFAYLLRNSEQRLKIQLINLLKNSMSIPLYLKQFEDISQCSESALKITDELLWIMKESFTITSIGLHSQNKSQEQKGKSSLLNEIFLVSFEQTQKKHAITKEIPYIALRVLDDLYPLNVIDIPRDCSNEISEQILANSNMIFIHSWKDARQSKDKMKQLKIKYGVPVICLMRDYESQNYMSTFKEGYNYDEEPLKMMNLSNKQASKQRVNFIKKKIFEILEKKMTNKSNSKNILNIFKQKEIYKQFTKLVSVIENNIFDLAPLGKQMLSIKLKQRITDTNIINKQKKQAVKKLRTEIIKIIDFLMRDSVKSEQNLLLSLLRQKIKTYQMQMNMKLVRIYQFRDEFKNQIRLANLKQRQQKIIELNNKLTIFGKFNKKSILNLDNSAIEDIIETMISDYENQIKPRIFSIELFWRQLFYLTAYNEDYKINQRPILEAMKQLKDIQISNNFPFQVVDGDLLEMPRKIMSSLFQNRNDKAVVITVIGPQSSGKSTLLNFLFGCDFATSEGRCTRGIYGTYFEFSKNRGSFDGIRNCQGLFLIDTQGLFALTNEKDKQGIDRKKFDQKLVLFCLAVSDFVVINVRGNIDNNTEKMVRLCNQRLNDLKLTQDRRPQTVVVLNQNAANKKDESENQFKQIKKSIQFNLSAALSLAYRIDNYGSQDICILGKNQKLTKKYPLQSFYKETRKLMKQILVSINKKKNILTLSKIIENFERVWSMVIQFKAIANIATPQYRLVQNSIIEWQRDINDKVSNKIKLLTEQFKANNIQKRKCFEKIDDCFRQLEEQFDQRFKLGDDDDINMLIKKQKGEFISQRNRQKMNMQSAITRIETQNILLKQKMEGNHIMREKARELSRCSVQCSEEDLRKIFDKLFKQQLQNIQNKLNLRSQPNQLLNNIYKNYQYEMHKYSGCQIGMPSKEQFFGLVGPSQDFNGTMQKIRERYIKPNENKFEDIFVHTNKINTNVLRGGRTNATLEYFDMKDYFKSEQIKQYTCIDRQAIKNLLRRQQLSSYYQSLVRQKENIQGQNKIRQIWEEINRSLKTIGIVFPNYKQFHGLVLNHQESLFAKVLNFFVKEDKSISFHFLSHCNIKCPIHQQGFKGIQGKKNNHVFKYLILIIDQTCLCKYASSYNPKLIQFIGRRLYKHIDWEMVIEQFQKVTDNSAINRHMTQIVNKELEKINVQILNEVKWQSFLLGRSLNQQNLIFGSCHEAKMVINDIQISNQVEQTKFIDVREAKKKLVKKQEIQMKDKLFYLPMFSVKTKKFEPINNLPHLQTYVSKNTQLTFQQFDKPPFRRFILQQLKKKKSLEKLYYAIVDIVKDVMNQWNQKIQNKTYCEIINKVNQQISKFNDDMNQVSSQLQKRYIGRIHLCVVYMIWKIVISHTIQKNKKLINEKKAEEQKQWESFKAKASKNEDISTKVDVQEFIAQFIQQISNIMEKKKQSFMKNQKQEFETNYSRKNVQDRIDKEIFQKNTAPQIILEYLQSPQIIIQKKYIQFYDDTWKDLEIIYKNNNGARQIISQFYECVDSFQQSLTNQGITHQKGNFQDIFQIVQHSVINMSQQHMTTRDSYQQHGKRILFEFFIQSLIEKTVVTIKKCANIEVQQRKKISVPRKANGQLQQILSKVKDQGHLNFSNLFKFTSRILSVEVKKYIQEQLDQKIIMSNEDKKKYLNEVRVVICSQKCPCCGRICGLVNQYHSHHQCIYGHQMRGLNGSYFRTSSNQKEASVVRCEDMAQPDKIQYNGGVMTWFEFKKYWQQKNPGGWQYTDCYNSINQNRQIFERAWTIAGPIYCKKNGLNYVAYNKASDQKQKGNAKSNVHYIFALDSSGSMIDNWDGLIKIFNDTLQKMIEMYKGTNRARVSLMGFNCQVNLKCENLPPQEVTDMPQLTNRTTNFDNPFNKAAQIAKRYIDNSIIVFIFMTDGQAEYPNEGVNALLQLQNNYSIDRMRFVGIQFGVNVQVIKDIATILRATSGVAYNLTQLSALFQNSIEVIVCKQ